MRKAKKAALSLVCVFMMGGTVGVATQALMVLFGLIGLDGLSVAMLTLLCLGIVGCLVFVAGRHERMERYGAMSFLPFYGLGAAVAKSYRDARRGGLSSGGAVQASLKFFCVATGAGITVALIAGFIGVLVV